MVQTSSNRFEPEPNQNHRFSSGFGHMARTEPGVQFRVRKFYPLNRTEPNFSITNCDILIDRCSLQPCLCCSTRRLSVLIVIYLYTDVRCNPPFVAVLGGYQYSL